MIRVLLVDDSPSVRAVLRRFLNRAPDIEVVGEASDGEQAVRLVLELSPQVVVMDLQMPVMDGYAAMERILELKPTPVLVLSSRANRNQIQTAFESIRRGALEVFPKPEDMESWRLLAESLPKTVRAVAGVVEASPEPRPRPARPVVPAAPAVRRELRWVGVGASTGGPAALRELLEAIPPRPPVSILVVQHIAPGFEAGLADWLGKELTLSVKIARHREEPRPGEVRLAPCGSHLRLAPGGVLHLDTSAPPRQGHRPSVDELFLSLAQVAPARSAAMLLTGMGSDGATGLAEVQRRGGLTLAQDEASSVVWGMPRVAVERGLVDTVQTPAGLARHLARSWLQR